jgi:hypothetical protein
MQELAENLWRVESAVPAMPLQRAMTVARRADGRLVIHSAILMEEPAVTELERLGEPAFLVVRSKYHRTDAPAYKARILPDARPFAGGRAPGRAEARRGRRYVRGLPVSCG